MPVYRYKLNGPKIETLQNYVPGTPTFTAAGVYYVDITVAAGSKSDLDEAMAAEGYTYVSQDPTNTPTDEAGTQGTDKVSVQQGGSLVAKQPAVNFTGAGVSVSNDGANSRVNVTIAGGASVTNTAPVNVDVAAAVVGTSAEAARQDHKHSVSVAAPSDIGTANSAGASNNLVRADHVHNLPFSVVQTVLGTASSAVGFNAQRLTGVADPTSAQDAATKAYVDATKQGLDIKDSVRAATTANLTLSGTQTIDGVACVAGDRVLVKNQTTQSANGIYVVAAGAWARASDADTSAKVTSGLFTFVIEGTANGGNGFVLTTADPIVLGTTALTFTQFSGAGQITAGAGLTKTGNTIDAVANADGSIVVNANDIQVGILATDAQHGTRGGGTLHAAATGATAGFMSAADKTKLDGLPATVPTSMLMWGNASIGTSTTLRYLSPSYDPNAASTANPHDFRAPRAGTLRNLRVRQVAGTGAANLTYTLRVNGVNTALACTFANNTTDGSDLANSVSIAAGGLLSFTVTKAASVTTSPVDVIATVEYA